MTTQTALRDFLSHEWQDLASVSSQIYDKLGIPIKPERLGRLLTSNYPDVVLSDGILVRIQPEITEAHDAPQHQQPPTDQRRRA
jgi:hypothetical protein